MKGPLLSLLLLQVLPAVCQPLTQYTLHNGEPCFQLAAVVDTERCYTLVSGNSQSWTAAVSACRRNGLKPVVVGDRDTHVALVAVMKNQQLEHVWLPATLDRNSWYWAGTSEIVLGTYSAWRSGHPLSPERSDLKDCVMAITYLGLPWEDKECAFGTGFICQADVGTKLCDDGRSLFDEVVYVDNICLLVSNQRLSFFKARDRCAELNAQLLRVQDEATQNALRRVTSWNTTFTYGYWIGLTRTRWLWENGEEVSVSFWEASQPSMSNADCAVLKKFSEINYFWANWNCEAHLPYICVADIPVETTTQNVSSILTQTLPFTINTSSSTISEPTAISKITTTTGPSTTPTSSTSPLPSTMTRSTKTSITSPSETTLTPQPSSEEAPFSTSIPSSTTLTPSSPMESLTPISPRTTSSRTPITTPYPTTAPTATPSTTYSTTSSTASSPPTPSTTSSLSTPSITPSPTTPSTAPSTTLPLTASLTTHLKTTSSPTTLSPTTSSTISSQNTSSTTTFPTTTSIKPSSTPPIGSQYQTTTPPSSTVPALTTPSLTPSSTTVSLLDLTSTVTTNLTSSVGPKSTEPPGTGLASEVVSATRSDATSAAAGEDLTSTLSAMSSTSSTESSTSTIVSATLFSTPTPASKTSSTTGMPPIIIKTETASNPPTSGMSTASLTTSEMTSLDPTTPSTRKAPPNPIPNSTIEYRTVTSSKSTSVSTGSIILGTILPSQRSPSSASISPSVSPPGTEPSTDRTGTSVTHSPNEVRDTGEVKQDDNSTVLAVAISLSILAIICIIVCGIVMYHRWKSRDPSQHPARAPSSKSSTSLYRKRSSNKGDADYGTSERRQMSRPEAIPNILHPAYYEPDLDPPAEDLVGEADTAAIEAGIHSEDSENMFVLADDTLFTVYDDEIDDFTYIDQFGMDRQLGSAEFVFVGRSYDGQRPSSGSTLSSFTGIKNKRSKRKDKTEIYLSKGISPQSTEITRLDETKSTSLLAKKSPGPSSNQEPGGNLPMSSPLARGSSGNQEPGGNLPTSSLPAPGPSSNQEPGGNLPTSSPLARGSSGNQEPSGNLPTSSLPAPGPSSNQEPGGNLPTSSPLARGSSGNQEPGGNLPRSSLPASRPLNNQVPGGNLSTSSLLAPGPLSNREPGGNLPMKSPLAPGPLSNQEPGGNLPISSLPAPRPSINQETGRSLPTSSPPAPRPSSNQVPGGNLPTTSPSKPSGKQETGEGLKPLQAPPLPSVPSPKLAANGPSFKKEPTKEDPPKLRSILKNSNKRANNAENGRRKGWRRSANRDSRTSEKSDRSSRHSEVSWEDGGLVDERPVSEEVLASTYGLLISNMDKYTQSWAVPYPGDNVPVTEL